MHAQTTNNLNRRIFIKRALLLAALPALPLSLACGGAKETRAAAQDWAGAADAPGQLSWRTNITAANEPGEPLVMSGTIYETDGRTPARGVLLYVYHTDATGYYNQPNRLPARLRGWMRTGADGRYEFRTIKPGGYPGRSDPAHIHATLTRADYPEYWIDSYWFAGDPRITKDKLAQLSGRGGFEPIVKLTRDAQGAWRGVRDLKLQKV
jgi:protocatechuate 3,4-dioxygenase beta subunit